MAGEKLIIVWHLNEGQELTDELIEELAQRNKTLLNFKRISGYLTWPEEFPRTASMKIKRQVLAEEIRHRFTRQSALKDL